MSMRVSGFEKFRLTQQYMMDIQTQVAKKAQQISTGKHFFKVSDDPVRVNRSMMVDSTENRILQYQRNLSDAKGLLEFIDTTYGKAVTSIQEVEELMLRGANGTYTEQDRQVVADGLDEAIKQMVGFANSQYAGRHMFSGQMTDTPPVTYDGTNVAYAGNAVAMNYTISTQMEVEVSQTADTVFIPLIQEMITLRDAFRANDSAGMEAGMAAVKGAGDALVDHRSKVGVQLESIRVMNEAYEQTKVDLQQKRKTVEDVDLSEVITDYTYLQTRYQASIQAQLKMMENTILNYM